MTKKIAFYISNHGFGHASRNIPIISTLLKLENDLELHIKTGAGQIAFMKSHLKEDARLSFYEEDLDVGTIVKEGTLLIDEEETIERVQAFVDTWEERIEREKIFLEEQDIGMIVSDICPWVLLAADDLRIKSIAISNFTWVELYQGFLPEELCDAYRECYEAASQVYIYDLHHPEMENCNSNFELLSLVCRAFDMEEVERIKAEHKNPIVFLSLSVLVTLEQDIEVGHLPYDFIVTPGVKVKGENVTYLPAVTKNTQNYVAASQFVITKAGWSTTSEILLCNKKAALLCRPNAVEDTNTISLLKERNQCIEITDEDLKDVGNILERLKEFRFSFDHEYHNDDYEIAKKISFAYPKRRRRRG